MNRRDAVLRLLALCLGPRIAKAQSDGKVPVVGMLFASEAHPAYQTIKLGLRDLGYVEGRTIKFESRFWGGVSERLPALVQGLMQANPDVIVAAAAPAVRAVMRATKSIPIVFVGVGGDPVALGLVRDLAHPGANVTGFTHMSNDLGGKQSQILKEAFPNISALTALVNPSNPSGNYFEGIENAARALGIKAFRVEARDVKGLEPAFKATARNPNPALLVMPDAFLLAQSPRIVGLAASNRVPTIFSFSVDAEAGGLMSYGPDLPDHYRRVASTVHKVLKGEKAGDIPVERASKFELVINLKTAKALGLAIPQSVLLRADRVIE